TLPTVIHAIIALSLNVAPYPSQIIPAPIFSIPKPQTQPPYSIPINYTQTLQPIVLPQPIPLSIPPLPNTFLTLIKNTSLLPFILLPQMFT
ncbi:ABC transporter permease, partial [Staphylococcus epidermidis]